jgi:hypothetical protein
VLKLNIIHNTLIRNTNWIDLMKFFVGIVSKSKNNFHLGYLERMKELVDVYLIMVNLSGPTLNDELYNCYMLKNVKMS